MRNRKTAVKGLKKSKTPDEVLRLLGEVIEAALLATESGTAVSEVLTLRLQGAVKALKELELRDALHILCRDGVGSLVRQLAPFDTFPTKKVRFNVFPESMEKLERVAKARGTKTKKSSMDTVLEFLFNGLPLDYWNRKAEVAALLSEHLPSTSHATPVSLAMNGLGYALLQDLADILDQSQGAVLEAATEMWLTELRSVRAKTEKALKIIDEFSSQAAAVEKHLEEIFGGPSPKIFEDHDPICSRFGYVMVILGNLCAAIESNISEGVPIDPDDL